MVDSFHRMVTEGWINSIAKFLADAYEICTDSFLKNFATVHLLKAVPLIKTIYMQSFKLQLLLP